MTMLLRIALLCTAFGLPVDTPAASPVEFALPSHDRIQEFASDLIDEWEEYRCAIDPNFDVDGLARAVAYAAQMHEGQFRKDAERTPYILHPLQVCDNLWTIGGVRNSHILIAAILHDTVEDTEATPEEISRLFGLRVSKTVVEVSNDPTLTTAENKQRQIDHAPQMSQDARLVKLADRLANCRDLRTPPPSWSSEKVQGYYTWGEKLLEALRGTNAMLEEALAEEITLGRATSSPSEEGTGRRPVTARATSAEAFHQPESRG